MKIFICSLALSAAIEGICFALFPDLIRKCMEEILQKENNAIRATGGMLLCIAIALAWLGARFN